VPGERSCRESDSLMRQIAPPPLLANCSRQSIRNMQTGLAIMRAVPQGRVVLVLTFAEIALFSSPRGGARDDGAPKQIPLSDGDPRSTTTERHPNRCLPYVTPASLFASIEIEAFFDSISESRLSAILAMVTLLELEYFLRIGFYDQF